MITEASLDTSGRRLGWLLLGYLGAVVGLIVLAPFQLDPGRLVGATWMPLADASLRDVVLNVVLFLPLGFLHERLNGGRWRPVAVLVAAVVVSSAIEVTQLMIPGRYSSVLDIAANGVGGWLGAVASVAVRRRLGGGLRLVGRFFLDLPLVGLCWLLIPWLWLTTLSGGSHSRTWLAVVLAAAAGVALAAAGRSGAPTGQASGRPLLGKLALGWAAVGLLPLVTARAGVGGLALAALALALYAADRWWGRANRTDRRVEPGAVAVILLLLLPWFVTTSPAMGSLGWSSHGPAARSDTLAVVELLVGYSVLGYTLAEQSGRHASGTVRGLGAAALATLLLASPLRAGMTPLRSGVLLVAALLGVLIYRAQRRHIMRLLEVRPDAN